MRSESDAATISTEVEELASPARATGMRAPGRTRITLPVKTTLGLLTLLVGAVGLCGVVILIATRSMLQENKHSQVSQLAYGLAAMLGSEGGGKSEEIEHDLASLDKMPDLDFAVLTDTNMVIQGGHYGTPPAWSAFGAEMGPGSTGLAGKVGQVRELRHESRTSYVVSVPVFTGKKGRNTLVGYLHVASSSEGVEAKLRYLQGFILLTCMGVVLLAVPIAGLIARHITVPIQRLAQGAHALAEGELSHRVEIKRSDELGELAVAFNRMADTVQSQQEDIRQANQGLEQKVQERTGELEKVNRRLKAEISEKEDFLRAVSHDLNAPLRNIAGMASMLIIKYQATLEKDALQRLERIQKNVEIESELINELLELSRIKTRREKLDDVDLHELVGSVADQFSSDFETKRITLKLTSHLPVMHCERSRFRQVFQNLIDNAVKYMREDGPREICVGMEREKNDVVLSFRDTGMGIAADELPHLFHVFRRAKSASMLKIPGKGVGLASVKSIVENYHGRLWAESTPGVGTTFFLSIPENHFVTTAQEVAA